MRDDGVSLETCRSRKRRRTDARQPASQHRRRPRHDRSLKIAGVPHDGGVAVSLVGVGRGPARRESVERDEEKVEEADGRGVEEVDEEAKVEEREAGSAMAQTANETNEATHVNILVVVAASSRRAWRAKQRKARGGRSEPSADKPERRTGARSARAPPEQRPDRDRSIDRKRRNCEQRRDRQQGVRAQRGESESKRRTLARVQVKLDVVEIRDRYRTLSKPKREQQSSTSMRSSLSAGTTASWNIAMQDKVNL